MPLPLTVSCFSKIQIGSTFLVPAHLGSPGKRAVKWMCVCVCVCVLSDRIWKASCHFVIVRRWATACLFKRWIRQTFHWLWRNASTLLQYMVCDSVFTSCCSLTSKIWTDNNFLKYIFYNVIWVWWWIKKGWGQWLFFLVWISAFRVWISVFCALTLSVGHQEEHPACKSWVIRHWCGYLYGARCRLFTCCPADATA